MTYSYSVAIRTLGKAGVKYQQTLESLKHQTLKPDAINIYIAEGYPVPQETIGEEKYIYVRKGMVSQRALQYEEIESEYILFLDDDVYLPNDSVECLFRELELNHADVISPDVFDNAGRPISNQIAMAISGRMLPRYFDAEHGYLVMRNSGFSYNARPSRAVVYSESNAGPCFLCKKSSFLRINFHEEKWVEDMPYAIGDDQVMFYKMHRMGLKVLTTYDTGVEHLDAGTTMMNQDKEKTLAYCDTRFKLIFWHRFIWIPEHKKLKRLYCLCGISYLLLFSIASSCIRMRKDILDQKIAGIRSAVKYLRSPQYKKLTLIPER